MEHKRERWVDDVKVIACIFVVLGHFFQSMVKADILPVNDLYMWFNQTIYFFHVPLFFICSGYLYQKLSCVDSFASWKKNIVRKGIVLGVPYVTFTIATWLLKVVFSNSINSGNEDGLLSVLFLHPASPYWYLYALFFIFLITPTFQGFQMAVGGLVIAFIGKIISFTQIGELGIYVISTVLSNEIWFVLGMCLAISNVQPRKKWMGFGIILGGMFLISSIVTYVLAIKMNMISFVLGILACTSIIAIVGGWDNRKKQSEFFVYMAKYTMPIFLMHTLFSAAMRSVLLKCAISNAGIHIICGIVIGVVGPMIATKISEKIKVLEFFIYPGKYLKVK